MRLHRTHKRATTWIAILAVLMMALAPLISQAAGAERAWQEICGTNGSRWVQADGSAPAKPTDTSAAHHLDHCPYCSVHASALGMPPAPLAVLAASRYLEMPPAFLAAPRTLHAWRTAQPRGPPRLS